jgi:hypothetical protein
VLLFAMVLRRSEPKMARSWHAAPLLNKLKGPPPDLEGRFGAFHALISSSSSCHGGGSWRMDLEGGARGSVREAIPEARSRSSSAKVKVADVIHGQRRPQHDVVLGWHRSFFFLHANVPMRKIFGLRVALHCSDDPSGIVPRC